MAKPQKKNNKQVEVIDGSPRNKALSNRVEVHTQSWSGPLPSPEDLIKYSQVDPTFPNRLMESFESQSAHRQELEKTVVKGNQADQRTALWLSFFIMMAILGVGAMVALSKDPWAGAAIIAGDLLAGGAVYWKGKSAQRKELDENRQS